MCTRISVATAGNFGRTLAVLTTMLLVGCASPLAQRFHAHIEYLASDQLEGRGVGTAGIDLAAEYIASEFEKSGLKPAGDNGTFFQSFPMTLHRELTGNGRLTFTGNTSPLRQGKEFIPFSFSSDDSFSGSVAFGGYGIVATDREHHDFAHLDVAGKVVIMLRGEPPSWADDRGNSTPHAMFQNKVYNAKDRGAVAVLLVNQSPTSGESDDLMSFDAQSAAAYGLPVMHITRAVADAILARANADNLNKLQERLDSGGMASTDLEGIDAQGQAGFEKRSAPVRNVLGILAGNGANRDEVVVIGAHYDHLGIRRPMMRKFKDGKLVREKMEPQIHNGADDNASGTSGLIEIARKLAEGTRPDRSILFIAFTAEESGLHGSKFYVDNPVVPLERTVAMLNMDMIGRLESRSKEVQVFGAHSGKPFLGILARAAKLEGLKIAPTPDEGGRSDHAPFVRNDIPAMHFFTGQHADYHKPTDDTHKINSRNGARVLSMVHRVALEIANREERPQYQKVEDEPAPSAGGTPTYRVVMGLAPGYGDDGKPGMLVDAVSPQGPASVAGMKKGDRIIRISGKDVANVYDYMAATRDNSPGDEVSVVVLRGGKEINLKVTLSGAG